MAEELIVFLYSILYFAAFSRIGSVYSSEMQNIAQYKAQLKSGKFNVEKLETKIKLSVKRIRKMKRVTFVVFGALLAVHLLLNRLTLDSNEFYYFIVISCFLFLILLLGVFMLKGNGTIDSNPRMHGGMRI